MINRYGLFLIMLSLFFIAIISEKPVDGYAWNLTPPSIQKSSSIKDLNYSDIATLKYFRFYFASTKNDSFTAGNHTVEICNSFGIRNDEDYGKKALANLIYEASADKITDIWWKDQAIWNKSYIRWKFPQNFLLPEGKQVFRGFVTGYAEKHIPIYLHRSVNKTIFNKTGYQLVNVTVRFEDLNFTWSAINLEAWDSRFVHPEIVSGTFYTDAPISYYEEDLWHIHVELNKSKMLNEEYNFSFVVKVNLDGNYSVNYLPRISAEYGYNWTRFFIGNGYIAEIPSEYLPDDVNFVRVRTNLSNAWYGEKGEYYIAVLQGKISVRDPIAKFNYFRIHNAYGEDSVKAGIQNTSIWNSISLYNFDDGSDANISSIVFKAYAKRIYDVWKQNRASWNETFVEWNFGNYKLPENSGINVGFKTGYVEDYIPINVERSFNRTVFNESGYQMMQVNFSVTDTNFKWLHITIYPEGNENVQTEIANYSKDFSSRFEYFGKSLEFELSPEQIEVNKIYHINVIMHVSVMDGLPYLVKPYVHVEVGKSYYERYYGFTNSPEYIPSYNDTNLVKAEIAEFNYFWIANGSIKRAVLIPEIKLNNLAKIDYYPVEAYVSYSDVITPGNYKLTNISHLKILNLKDDFGKNISGFDVYLESKKAILDFYGDSPVINRTTAFWELRDHEICDGCQYNLGLVTEGRNRYVPFAIHRIVNKSVFDREGYQIANFTFEFYNTSGKFCYFVVQMKDNATIKPRIVNLISTDFPLDELYVNPYYISGGCNCSKVEEGREYNVSVIIKINIVRSTQHSVTYKPEFRLLRIIHDETKYYGNSSKVIWHPSIGDLYTIELNTTSNFTWLLRIAQHNGAITKQVYDIKFKGSYLFYDRGWHVPIAQNKTIWMIRALNSTKEIGYDDGNIDGSFSIGFRSNNYGSGHAMLFDVTPPFNLTGIKVFGRYYCNNSKDFCSSILNNQSFIVFILDSKMNLIEKEEYKYSDYFSENFSWVYVPIKPVLIKENNFYVIIDTNSSAPDKDWRSGIEIGYDVKSVSEYIRSFEFAWIKFALRGDMDEDGKF